MGIAVECPNGHTFKVKDKYAGKKGLCPFCKGKEVFVRVPDMDSSGILDDAVARAVREQRGGRAPSLSDSSIFDEAADKSASTSGSLIGSSAVRHNVRCKCGESVPMWFAKCPKCGEFLEHL